MGAQVDTGNDAAREFIPQDVLDDPVIFPPEEVLARLSVIENLGDAEKLYDEGWQQVEAG